MGGSVDRVVDGWVHTDGRAVARTGVVVGDDVLAADNAERDGALARIAIELRLRDRRVARRAGPVGASILSIQAHKSQGTARGA